MAASLGPMWLKRSCSPSDAIPTSDHVAPDRGGKSSPSGSVAPQHRPWDGRPACPGGSPLKQAPQVLHRIQKSFERHVIDLDISPSDSPTEKRFYPLGAYR
jgi:hypothetical protein